jgi:CubicO group peptidase (beta-lactamase class C family)
LAKQVTAACAALLALSGALDPEAAIAEWLPELPAWAERVRHLIHHTSGLRDGLTTEPEWTADGALAALAELPRLDRDPGSAYAYCGAGYICLASIVERIAGIPFPQFARARLFEPLGMNSSTFWMGPRACGGRELAGRPQRGLER